MGQVRGDSDRQEPGQPAMPAGSHAVPPRKFMDRLMAQANPQRPPPDTARLDAQRACGRWFALQRLRLALTAEQLGGMVDLPADDIQLLEAGLAEPGCLSDVASQRLRRLLRQRREDSAWVAQVIAIAAGQTEALDVLVMDRVVAELDDADTPTQRDRELTMVVVHTPSPPPSAPPDASQLRENPDMFEILRALSDGESYIYAIWEQVRQRTGSIGIATIVELLERMRADKLIADADERLVPELDSEPLQFYRITDIGRQAFNAERTRRARLKAEQQADALAEPGGDTATHMPKT